MDFLYRIIVERNIRKSKFLIIGFCVLMSLLAIIGWVLKEDYVGFLGAEKANMKFNTALLFLCTAVNLAIYDAYLGNTQKLFKTLNFLVVCVGLFSLAEYLMALPFAIDNIIVQDGFSRLLPGRMSPATALCFILLGVGFESMHSKNAIFCTVGQTALLFVSLVSLVSMVSYLLNTPYESKVFFMQTMSLNTSLLFLGISVVLQLDNPEGELTKLLKGRHNGSLMFLKFIPFIVLVPILLAILFLNAVDNSVFSVHFGISLFTVLLIVSGIIYIYILAKGLNETDIRRFNLEAALKTSNQELAQFKDGLDQVAIVALTDKKGVITYVNKKFCDISKYAEDELLGQTHAIINSGHHSKAFFRDLWRTIGSGTTWVGNIKNRAKDGSYYWVNTAIVPFKDSQGNVIEYMAIRQDITQEKLAEELLHSDYVKKLEYKNKELEQFVYIASHDLQEPLRTLKSFSSLLLESQAEQLNEEGVLSLNFISESATRMSNLIKDLLDYSRIGRNRNLTTIDCNHLLGTLISDLKNTIERTGTKLEVAHLPTISGYPTELRLLFQNLITNAIKFQAKDTTPLIQINSEKIEGGWKFSVRDNGIGIKEEHKDKIFIIFQRLHSQEDYSGTGIGLAHCLKIVEMHGGKIWVESQVGEGSTFFFTIKD